ncbi:hypothetical protein [Alicyclobacillus dauci]|uniref:Uncharacterized protein n=1 Tax=Alicyclobacillus dauci TaxID=1475485 RepID=A0ABY6Z620_9BACL|nr:hypothetical protein [Alicyclobacillus dauci]WAH37761.1 hypothetical protein NZD86_04460 [Alicyclobacillus dauci]
MQSLSDGRQLYADIDEWYEHSRQALKRILNGSSCKLSPAELA